MLDVETKRRIDNARDILVGKVPDPKSQVEQITIALIYKFMDDMDRESAQMGGKASFFTGEYKKYAWTKMFDPKLGGADIFDLYTEAISKMSKNVGIPKLFRDIFKNAYLPYKDPETLKLFLKTINEFTYDHSEKLGDAFEYLLSVLGSQGDAGQFRTPRHIIDFIVSIVDPKKDETVLDPACGTAGFLISAYKHILNANMKKKPGDQLNPSEKKKLLSNFLGYDISPDMVRLSLVNLYLHGFQQPQIFEYDTLSSEDRWKEYADVILANPPFMSPKGGIKPHKRFSVQSNRSEVLFVDYMAEHLNPKGRAGIIVPEGIIFQSGNAYKDLRKMLVDKFLVAVISLPAGVFNPYSPVKTSILILDKTIAKESKTISFFKVENDGFGLGSQRRANDGGQLSQVALELGEYLSKLRNHKSLDVLKLSLGLIVAKEKIGAKEDYNLSGERYREEVVTSSIWPFVPIGECFRKSEETVLPKSLKEPVTYLGLENITQDNGQLIGDIVAEKPSEIKSLKNVFKPKEILFGKLRPNLNKVWLADRKGICSTDIFVIQPISEEVLSKFYAYIFRSKHFNKMVLTQIQGAQLPRVGWSSFARLEIPLPPLEIQKEIIGEIEAYQNVINGARTVLDNYHPHIPIDTEWPILKFEEAPFQIIDGDRGNNYPSKEDFAPDGYCLFLNTKNVRSDGFKFDELEFISAAKDNSLRKGKLERGDVLLTTRGTIGNTALYNESVRFDNIRINSGMLIFRPDATKLTSSFLFHFFQSENFKTQRDAIVSGAAQPQLPIRSLNEARLPLPPLETQQKIVAEIEAEEALVSGNRELIERFESKIQNSIARVWGHTLK